MSETSTAAPRVDYRTDPTQYRHWTLSVDTGGQDLAQSFARLRTAVREAMVQAG